MTFFEITKFIEILLIGITLIVILKLGGIIMAIQDDIQAAKTVLEAAVPVIINKLNDLKNNSGVPVEQVQPLIDAVNTSATALNQAAQ